jgi:lycopene cyclase domain-containing protein
MKAYLILLISIFFIPFLFSFEKKIYFIKNLISVLKSILVVAIPYLIWDELFTANGIWGFSDKHIIGLKILSLPLEEVLFFVVVPYSIIFLFEVFNFYVKDKVISINRLLLIFLAASFLVLTLIFYSKTYTAIQALIFSIFFTSAYFVKFEILSSRNFWIFIFLSFIPFFVVNYFLTSLPIVWYNESKIIGLRIITIPVEDFFYHFTLTSFYLLAYKYFQLKK